MVRIFLFDEPTRGIDVGAKFEIHELMRRLAKEGCAILVISSELPEVMAVSDRIGVMPEGRLVQTIADGAPDIIQEAGGSCPSKRNPRRYESFRCRVCQGA